MEVEPPPAACSQQQQRPSTVLQALAEQTQKTVQQQSRLRPPSSGSAAAMDASGSGGAPGEQQHVNMIVDTVMQHLLSKDVLYQPMKVTINGSGVEAAVLCRPRPFIFANRPQHGYGWCDSQPAHP
jgi:hypothetical protein